MKGISLTQLFTTLLAPLKGREYIKLPDSNMVATTVRLESDVRDFYNDAANELEISLQSMINLTLSGVMKVSLGGAKSETNLMIDRFFELFKSNGIAVADIPSFLGQNKISLSTLAQNDRLLDALTPEVINNISNLFGINTNWLKGITGSNARPILPKKGMWYQSPGRLCNHLNRLSVDGYEPELIFVSNGTVQEMQEDRVNQTERVSVGIIMRIPMHSTTGFSYDLFEVYENESWYYDKARIDLKILMLFCIQNHFAIRGVQLTHSGFENFFSGEIFPGNAVKKQIKIWEPVDYVSAGFHFDKDTDELFTIVKHYCDHYNIRDKYDGNGAPNRADSFYQFALKLDKYKSNKTESIKELLDTKSKQYLEKKLENIVN